MSYNRFPDGPGCENSVDRNIIDYIRIVVLDINLEEVELEMLNLRKQQFVFLDTSINDNPVLIERHSSQRPPTRNQLWKLACRYTGRFFKQYVHYGSNRLILNAGRAHGEFKQISKGLYVINRRVPISKVSYYALSPHLDFGPEGEITS